MGKRGNDMSQLSKEEFEAAMNRDSSSVGDGFAKAPDEVLKGRRILRTNSKWKKPQTAVTSASASSSSTPTPSLGGAVGAAAPANPFSNFSFTKASTSTSLTAPSIAAKAQSTSFGSTKPAFAMPSLPTNNFSNSNKTLSLSESLLSSNTSTQQSSGDQSDISQLAEGFKEFIERQNIRTDWTLPMNRFINTYNKLKGSKKSFTSSSTAASNISSFGGFGGATGTSTNVSTGASSMPSKPLFPPATSTPAPALFSFGSAPPSGNVAAPKPTFSFGNPTSSSPAPPPPSSTGFGFTFGGATSSTGSTSTPAASTTASENENEDSANTNEEESSTLESADKEWNQVYSTKVKAYHHRDKAAGAKSFATGELKLQELKSNAAVKRMVMRDISGKVTLNVAISSSMEFKATRTQMRKGKTIARVQFVCIREVGHEAELITLVCKTELLDEFHQKLVAMSS